MGVQSEAPDANGATYSSTGSSTACYAEFGMTGVNGSAAWQTCIFSMEPVCGFVQGDGVGGTEAGVGSAGDAQACAALVIANEPTANGATFSNTGGTGCYAEFGMTVPTILLAGSPACSMALSAVKCGQGEP